MDDREFTEEEIVSGEVAFEVASERDAQRAKGWTATHDDAHSHPEMLALVLHRLGCVTDFIPPHTTGRQDWDTLGMARIYIKQAAALCVAWIEKIDREVTR